MAIDFFDTNVSDADMFANSKRADWCEHGFMGHCCCNCKNQITLMKSPCNKGIFNGSIGDPSGLYACSALKNYDHPTINFAIIYELKHGMSELHINK